MGVEFIIFGMAWYASPADLTEPPSRRTRFAWYAGSMLLSCVLIATGLRLDQVAYLGDDVNDLGVMEVIAPAGLIAAPGDAMRSVTDVVHFVTESQGGHGAFREFAEWLLSLRGADA